MSFATDTGRGGRDDGAAEDGAVDGASPGVVNWGGAFLGEVIVWNRALDETERAAVESHFQAHFGP